MPERKKAQPRCIVAHTDVCRKSENLRAFLAAEAKKETTYLGAGGRRRLEKVFGKLRTQSSPVQSLSARVRPFRG